MKTILMLLMVMLTGTAMGQAVYKCPQPDGSLKYQSARCPDGTRGRIHIQDNGVVSGPANVTPVPVPVSTEPAKPEPTLVVRPQRSVTDSQAWKGNERIIQESTQTINALQRLQRRK